jgi:hypothetical protein
MIVVTNGAVFNHCADGAIRGLTFEPVRCACGRVTYFFVNREGRSRCVDCDAEFMQRKEKCSRN